MRVAVLGAGVVGVTSAWYLAQAGHEVTVVDRQPDSALETSHANGGQISAGHAEPWAGPRTPWQMLSWLGSESSPLLWRLRADPDQWRWGLDFLGQCRAAPARRNTEALLRLALHSRALLKRLREEQDIEYDLVARGILRLFSNERELARASILQETYARFGYAREVLSPAQCLAMEPALAEGGVSFVGGIYSPGDESGDARKFTQRLALRCAASGVRFRHDAAVEAVEVEGGHVACARLAGGEALRADVYVAALGSHTPLLLRPHGLRIPVYPAKGYSLTVPLAADDIAPMVSLTDDKHKLVFSRLGDALRVAGTVEFAGYDSGINHQRCAVIAGRVRQLFPRLRWLDRAEPWAGLRPATPGNVPVIGRCGPPNLYLNTGHGTLGWTLACGSAKLLADLVSGSEPDVAPEPYRP